MNRYSNRYQNNPLGTEFDMTKSANNTNNNNPENIYNFINTPYRVVNRKQPEEITDDIWRATVSNNTSKSMYGKVKPGNEKYGTNDMGEYLEFRRQRMKEIAQSRHDGSYNNPSKPWNRLEGGETDYVNHGTYNLRRVTGYKANGEPLQ
jgi:hypothetical protein